jgi:hypothetical protein
MTQILPIGITAGNDHRLHRLQLETTIDYTDYIAQQKSVKLHIIGGIAKQCAAKICEIREICGRKKWVLIFNF